MKHQLINGLVVLSLGLAATTASAAVTTVNLCVGATTIIMPPNSDFPAGEIVDMWGYGLDDGSTNCDTAQVPGPPLTVPPGNSLTVILRNALTGSGAEFVSLVIPGQTLPKISAGGVQHGAVVFTPLGDPRPRVRSFVGEATFIANNQYHWDSLQPGTYLYQSGSHQQIQVGMGLYGAVTHDAAAGAVYPGESYDQQVTLLYSEVDPALNAAVAAGTYTSCSGGFASCNADLANGDTPSAINYRPVYHMVNGEPFTSKLQAAHSIGGIPAINTRTDILIRFLNAGNETHVPVIQGGRWRVISENGEPYSYASNDAKTQYSVTLPAMTTRDVIFSIGDSVLNTTQVDTPTAFAVYDRALAVTNAVDEVPGGLISFLMADIDTDSDGVYNYADNCINVPNGPLLNNDIGGDIQRDSDGDGFGNLCDGDLNNDFPTVAVVDFLDLGTLGPLFFTTDPHADFDGSGLVDFADLGIFNTMFFQPPGPSCQVPNANPVLCPLQ